MTLRLKESCFVGRMNCAATKSKEVCKERDEKIITCYVAVKLDISDETAVKKLKKEDSVMYEEWKIT